MAYLELTLAALTVVALLLGGWGVLWARSHTAPGRILWGKRLFLGTLLALAGLLALAAFYWPQHVVPPGLVAGWLVIAMLWEGPAPKAEVRDPRSDLRASQPTV